MKKLIFLLALASFSILFSCKKDRIDNNEFVSTADFYDQYKPEEQEFIIDSTGTDTIKGKDGTYIWNLGKTNFIYKSNFQDITYPYTLKLIEAYSIKNMILSQLPTTAQGNLLISGGEFKITAFKNGEELLIKEYRNINTYKATSSPDGAMELFYGFTKGTVKDWNNNIMATDYLFKDSLSSNVDAVTNPGTGYLSTIVKLGWINIDRFFSYTHKYVLSLVAQGVNTELIDVYIIFNNQHSFIKVSDLTAKDLPAGEPITVFAIAKNNEGKMLYYKENITPANDVTVALNMQEIGETELLAELDKL